MSETQDDTVEGAPMADQELDVNNFDYVVHEDGDIYMITGDRHRDDTLVGMRTYAADPDGGRHRESTGVRYSKSSRKGDAHPDGVAPSPAHFNHQEIPRDRVVEVVSPREELDRIRNDMADWKQELFDEVAAAAEQYGVEACVVGSETVGLATPDSDLDFMLMADDRDSWEAAYDAIVEQVDVDAYDQEGIESKFEKYGDRYGVAPAVAGHHIENPEPRLVEPKEGTKIGLIPSHEPGTFDDYFLPSDDDERRETDPLPVTVTGADNSMAFPISYTVETLTGEELELSTFHWTYWGSFEEGDTITVKGDFFPDDDSIWLREKGHYAAPDDT